MKSPYFLSVVVLGTLSLAACAATPPTGPNVLALPPVGKDLAQFRQEDAICRAYAQMQTGHATPQQVQNRSTATGAVAGGGIGAAAGALTGAAAGNAGAGAAIGAGTGLLVGSALGASSGSMSTAELQRRYDIAFAQCMAAHGNTVQPLTFDWPYRSYAYAYPDWGSYTPWIGPSFTFGFFGSHGFHRGFRHHGFARRGFHGGVRGGFHPGIHGGFHRR